MKYHCGIKKYILISCILFFSTPAVCSAQGEEKSIGDQPKSSIETQPQETQNTQLIHPKKNIPAIDSAIIANLKNPFIPQLPKPEVIIEEKSEEKEAKKNPIVPRTPSRPNAEEIMRRRLEEQRQQRQQLQRHTELPPQQEQSPPQLKIQGVIWNSDKPQTIINDTVLGIGDSILNAEILKINRDEIIIKFNEKEYKLKKKF